MTSVKQRLFITPDAANFYESFKEMFVGHFCEEPEDGGKRDASFDGFAGRWRIEEDSDKSKSMYISYGLKYNYLNGLDYEYLNKAIIPDSLDAIYLDTEFPYEVMMAFCVYFTKCYPEVTIYQMNMHKMRVMEEITHAEVEHKSENKGWKEVD